MPEFATYDPATGLTYVAEVVSPYFANLEGVTAINGSNWAYTFPACTGTSNSPDYVAYDPSNNYLYVACDYPGSVAVVNPRTDSVITTIAVGSSPQVVAYDPGDQDIYVSNYGSNTVSVISGTTNSVVATISTGDAPKWITYNPANQQVYVVDSETPYGITVINGTTNGLVTTLSIDASNAIYDPSSQNVYATVTTFVSGIQEAFVYAINTSNQIVAKIQVSGIGFSAAEYGGSLVYDSSNGNIFVATDPGTTSPNVVSEINSSTNTVLGSVNIPADCSSSGCYDVAYLTYDPANHNIYVSGPGMYVYIVSSSASLLQTIQLTVLSSPNTMDFPVVSIFDPASNEVLVLCSNYAEMIIPLSS